jgi:SAM-dependent methyltransferase
MHVDLLGRLDPRPGERWLDVACGPGAAARRVAGAGADVTGVDLSPALIETARRRAAQEGLSLRLDVGDAEQLPYEDASFDVVTSTVGVMFAPTPSAVAAELTRVARPGGRLGLTTWRPQGGVGDFFRTIAAFAPSPPDVPSPLDWGREEFVEDLLGDAFELEFAGGDVPYEPESGEEAWEEFSTSFGPVKAALAVLDEEGAAGLRGAFVDMIEAHRGEDGRLSQSREYLITVGTRR